MLGYVAEIDAETLAKYRPKGYEDLPRDEQQRDEPARLRGGRHRRRDGHRARLGVVPARAARMGEARRRRAGPLPHRAPRPSTWSTLRRAWIPSPGATCASRSTSSSSRRSSARCGRTPRARRSSIDVRTGRLLALYSKPDFDPNDLSGGAGKARVREAFNRLYADPLRPDARQDDERRVPARLDDEAVQRARRARGPRHRPRAHREVRGLRRLRAARLPLQPRPRQGAPARRHRAVVQRVLLPPRRDRRHGSHRAGGAGLRAGGQDRARRSTPRRRAASRRARGTRSATAGSSGWASRSTWRSARAT